MPDVARRPLAYTRANKMKTEVSKCSNLVKHNREQPGQQATV